MEKGLFLTDRITEKVERQFEDTTGKKERAKSTTASFVSKLKAVTQSKVNDYKQDLMLIQLQIEERLNEIQGNSIPESTKMKASLTKERELRKVNEDIESELNRLEDEMSMCVINDNLGKATMLLNNYIAIETEDINEQAYAVFNVRKEAIEQAYNEVITPSTVATDSVMIALNARKELITNTIEKANKINQRVI